VLVVVPRRDVVSWNVRVEDAMKMVISAGAMIPEQLRETPVVKADAGPEVLAETKTPGSSDSQD